MNMKKLGIWFPTVRCGTGTDVFTINLVEELNKRGIRAEITWLPLRAEYAPWSVPIPKPPNWATVVHVNTWLHNRFLPKNLPIIATIHHSIHDPNLRPYKGLNRALYHQYWIAPNERRVMKKAQHVIAVSQFVENMSKQTLCDVPMQVIYNAIDTKKFQPNTKIKNNEKQFRLLYVGSWMIRKGVDLLPIIMKELGNDFTLYYTGGTAAVKDKALMPPNMYDLGILNQKQVIEEMQKADAFLFPSRSEGLPLVVLEALSCGLPVFAIKGTAIDEIIISGVNGFTAIDVQDLINVLKSSRNKKMLINLSSAAPKLIQKKFSEKEMLNRYIELYKSFQNN